MRTSTGAEDTVLAATFRPTYVRVDIEDAAGAMQDVSSYSGYDWLCYVSIDEHIDQPIAGATVVLRRELDLVGGLGHTTLSPLRSDSPANPTGPTAYVYRSVKIYTAVVTGSRPSALSTDWKLKFDGVSDSVDMPDDDTLVIECRDKGAYLIDQWLFPVVGEGPSELLHAQRSGPRSLEWVTNKLLSAATVDGATETVYVPTDPNYIVTSFPLKYEPVMDALQRAAGLAACDFRYAWSNAASAYRFTLTSPERSSPTPAFTLGDADIISWKRVKIDRLGIRNYVKVSYLPKGSSTRATVLSKDDTSIADYGLRVLVIQEADDSSIDTQTEAQTLADAIRDDLKDPAITGEVVIDHDWRLEVNDYGTFSANKYSDADQDLAIVGIRHELMENDQITMLSVRGRPSSGYRRWIDRARNLVVSDLTEVDNGLSNVVRTDSTTGTTSTWTWDRGANVAFVAFYEAQVTAPITGASFPDPDTIPALAAAGTSGASILSSSTDTYTLSRPRFGSVRIGMAVPFYKKGGKYICGEPVKMQIDPGLNDDPRRAIRASATASTGPTTTEIVVAVYDPSLFRELEPSDVICVVEDAGGATVFSPTTSDANDNNETFTATFLLNRTVGVTAYARPYVTLNSRSQYDSTRGLGVSGAATKLADGFTDVLYVGEFTVPEL